MSPTKRRRPPGSLLDDLRKDAADCRRCDLWRRGTQTVFGEGDPKAVLMLVGEQPGDKEDLAGHPFVGSAGALLRAALAEAGVPIEACYLTNAVKHFKWIERGKRRIHERPRPDEILACRMWLDEEIAAVKPALILAMGVTSSVAVFGKAARIAKDRGKMLEARNGTPAMVTAHPSSILRTPEPADRRAARARLVADLRRAYREAIERGRRKS